jgi:uncharacterized protein (TIGR03067 family)
MFRFSFLLALTAVITPLHVHADDKKALDGTWTVVKAEADGKPEGEILKAKFTFRDGDKLVIKLLKEDKPLDGVAVKLDAAKKPKEIDLTRSFEGRSETATGIYELDGDRLKLCIAEPEVKARPTEFKSASRKVTYVELTRDKP